MVVLRAATLHGRSGRHSRQFRSRSGKRLLAKPGRAADHETVRLSPVRLVPLLALALLGGCALPKPYGEGVALHTLLSAGGGIRDHDEEDDFDGGAAYAIELSSLEPASG